MLRLSALVRKFNHVFLDRIYRMNRIPLVVGLDHPVHPGMRSKRGSPAPRSAGGSIRHRIYELASLAICP